MRVHVLLFDAGTDSEGIHSLEIGGRTVVLLFENPDDAERYAGLLEAQDFPVPSIEALDRVEVEAFCSEAGYEPRFIETGFLPGSDEERLFISPPESNRDVSRWKDEIDAETSNDSDDGDGSDSESAADSAVTSSPELDELRQRLEGLL
tara:strand:+ start:589 stop:1035 length:447 start_codon:yes stop_codon:yes gene_type:complete